MTPLVSIEHLSKTFPGQRALADVSFDVDRQEIHALVGENGSGKSTLIKVLCGFHLPDPGAHVLVDGEPLEEGSAADAKGHGLRFVHQDLGLIGQLSAVENVGLDSGFATRAAGKIAWAEQRARTRELLARIGVEFDVDKPVSQLRAVERSALAIARALDDSHGEIRLLVLDEPSSALPPAECEALFRVLREIVAKGVSILYVSHRLGEVLDLAGRITVLRDGAYQGTFDAKSMDRRSGRGLRADSPERRDVAVGPHVEEAADADAVGGIRTDDTHDRPLSQLPVKVVPQGGDGHGQADRAADPNPGPVVRASFRGPRDPAHSGERAGGERGQHGRRIEGERPGTRLERGGSFVPERPK